MSVEIAPITLGDPANVSQTESCLLRADGILTMSGSDQDDLLYQFRNWETSEEEQEAYNQVFLKEYYGELPAELQAIIRKKVQSYLEFLLPFGGCMKPWRWSYLEPSLVDGYNIIRKKIALRRLKARQ